MSDQTDATVDVWHVPTTDDNTLLSYYHSLLSEEEKQRCQDIVQSGFHDTYVTVHAALRMLLGKQLDLAPETIEINYPKNKKPHTTNSNIFFNISHSQNMSLIAISNQYEVGVDLETIQKKRNLDAIAERFFTDKEFHWLNNMDNELKEENFYQLWCHKEALLKGLGTGLQGGLDKFCLAEHDFNHPYYYKDWSVHTVKTDRSITAAVAIKSNRITIADQMWNHN